jgi:hypothetical protein
MRQGYDELMAQNWIEQFRRNWIRNQYSAPIRTKFMPGATWYNELGPFGGINFSWSDGGVPSEVWWVRCDSYIANNRRLLR